MGLHLTGSSLTTLNNAYARLHEMPLRARGDRFRTLTIIVYHSVTDTTAFGNDLDAYQEWNYTTVNFDDVQNHLDGVSTLPEKPLLITLDDGLASQYTAGQTLNTRGMKATYFVATGWIDGTVTQGQAGFAEATALTWPQIVQLKAWGHDIQAHTVSHTDLTTLTTAQTVAEFTASKARIEAQVSGQTVRHLAYPYGAWTAAMQAALKGAGCKLARQVRTAFDGTFPGASLGRYAIASTLHDPLALPCAGASFGDVQQPNYYRLLSVDPELVPDYGFEAGGKGWTLASGHIIDTTPANAYSGNNSLKATQQTSTTASKLTRPIPAGAFVKFALKVRIKTTGLPAGMLTKVQIQDIKADNTTVVSTVDAVTVTGNNGAWTEYAYVWLGSETTHYVQIYCWLQGTASPSGQAWFDVVSLKRETMPSLIANPVGA